MHQTVDLAYYRVDCFRLDRGIDYEIGHVVRQKQVVYF